MKKFLVVLLSLGLIVAFGATASAADVSFNGQYYVAGVFQSNPNLQADNLGPSQAFFQQRVRMGTIFKIADGLSFTTRFDALEKQWGNANWRRGAAVGDDTPSSRTIDSVAGANQPIQESIEFEQAYVTFMTGIGQFQIGYQDADVWGTAHANTPTTRPRLLYMTKMGDFTMMAIYEKFFEADRTGVATHIGKVDADNDTYALAGIYKKGAIEGGLLYKYYVMNANRVIGGAAKVMQLAPYFKATFGPVFVEGEFNYLFGKAFSSEIAGVQDITMNTWMAYLNAKMNLGPANFGALFAYATGDDYADATKNKNYAGNGYGWNPTLILLSDDMNNWTGAKVSNQGPVTGSSNRPTSTKKNTVYYGLYGGYKVTPKIDLFAALTYVTVADKHLAAGVEAVSDKLGTEFDMTATYKVYDNLSYMVGAGYLWTGDYFKLNNAAAKVDNDYLIMNKLTLSF